jgi:predicted Zn-dependent peptidase
MPDRTQPPAAQGLARFTLPAPARVTLQNGAVLAGLTGVQQEVVKIDWVFHAGRWHESHTGTAHMLALMLDKGSEKYTARQVAAALEGLGAQLEIQAGADFLFVSLYALEKNWPEALPIIEDLFTRPRFPEDELAIQKNISVENLRVSHEKTGYLAGRQLRALLYGSRHPYGASLEEADVLAIESRHLAHFHQAHFTLAGVFATVPAETHLEKIAALAGNVGRAGQSAAAEHAVVAGALRAHVPKAGSVQRSIRMGKRTVARTHPDYGALVLANHLLGGFFGSRLMKNIREEKGLTYGIHSSLQPLLNDTTLTISAEVNGENETVALAEIDLEISKLCTEPVTEKELETARNHFLGSFLSDMATPFSVMEKIKTASLYGLPADYYNGLFRQIEAGTPEAIQAVAARHLAGGWHQVTAG